MQRTIDSIDAELIRNAGLRATTPRLRLFAHLRKSKRPETVQAIARTLHGIDVVTIYRMLGVFAKTGLVREVNLKGERPRYELNDVEHDHHHLVCTNCHRLEDFIGCDIERIEKKALEQSHGFATVTGHSLDLYGLCNKCAQ